MKPETEVLVVATLDKMITKLDQVLDELELFPNKEVSHAEHLVMQVTMEITDLIDRVTEDGYETKNGKGEA